MNDVELEVSNGPTRFRGRGPKDWVEEQFAKIFNSDLLRQNTNPRGAKGDAGDTKLDPGAVSDGGERMARWMSQQQVTQHQLDKVFHQDGDKLEIIAKFLPGGNNKDRSINAYILAGLRSLLIGKEGRFTDEEARAVCGHYSVYDTNNHSRVINGLKPDVTGNKGTGWQLTAPGQIKAGQLIKQIAGEE